MVGQDWPDRYSELLSSRGIDLSGLIRHPTQKTYFWHGRYSNNLQDRETLFWEPNGTVLASFAVSGFSLEGLQRVQLTDIVRRKEEFGRMLVGE